MATTRPCSLVALHDGALLSGRTSASTSSMPSRRATALAVVQLSPVSMTTRMPSALRPRAPRASRPSPGRRWRWPPATFRRRQRRSRSRRLRAACRPASASGETSTPCSLRKAALPSTTCWPSTVPSAPLPVGESKSANRRGRDALLLRGARRWRARADARSRARRWPQAQDLGLVKSLRRARWRHGRLALGQRAGLVDDERVDLLHVLEGLGVLDQHAGLGAASDADHDRHRRRKPERARTGDDQHGDRRDEAVGEARLRAPDAPRRRRPAARPRSRPARTSPTPGRPGAGSARGCAGPRRRAARSATAWCRARPSRASMTSAPLWFMVPPMTLAPTSLVTGIDSPVTIDFVDGAAPLDDGAVDRHLLARAHPQAVADLHGVELRPPLPLPSRGCGGRSSARGRAARGWRRWCSRAPAAPAPVRAEPAP